MEDAVELFVMDESDDLGTPLRNTRAEPEEQLQKNETIEEIRLPKKTVKKTDLKFWRDNDNFYASMGSKQYGSPSPTLLLINLLTVPIDGELLEETLSLIRQQSTTWAACAPILLKDAGTQITTEESNAVFLKLVSFLCACPIIPTTAYEDAIKRKNAAELIENASFMDKAGPWSSKFDRYFDKILKFSNEPELLKRIINLPTPVGQDLLDSYLALNTPEYISHVLSVVEKKDRTTPQPADIGHAIQSSYIHATAAVDTSISNSNDRTIRRDATMWAAATTVCILFIISLVVLLSMWLIKRHRKISESPLIQPYAEQSYTHEERQPQVVEKTPVDILIPLQDKQLQTARPKIEQNTFTTMPPEFLRRLEQQNK